MPDARVYATREEVEAGLRDLTETDYAKLMMIARSFCYQRGLPSNVIEPAELLSEAILKTLQQDEGKRWNKRVSLLKHLDRAMENISGHLVRQRAKIVPFPDGLETIQHETDDALAKLSPARPLVEEENARALLKSVFGDDEQAAQVFRMKVEHFRPAEIQAALRLDALEYETITRRIHRKLLAFTTQPQRTTHYE